MPPHISIALCLLYPRRINIMSCLWAAIRHREVDDFSTLIFCTWWFNLSGVWLREGSTDQLLERVLTSFVSPLHVRELQLVFNLGATCQLVSLSWCGQHSQCGDGNHFWDFHLFVVLFLILQKIFKMLFKKKQLIKMLLENRQFACLYLFRKITILTAK